MKPLRFLDVTKIFAFMKSSFAFHLSGILDSSVEAKGKEEKSR